MKNEICKILGCNIKKIRKQRNLKQDELAELIGLEVKSLSLIETGNGFASAKTLSNLVSVLQIPVSELFEENDSDNADYLYFSIMKNINLIKSNSKKLLALNYVLKEML